MYGLGVGLEHEGACDPVAAVTSVSEARRRFAEICNRAAYGRERIAIDRHGKSRVAVVPYEDVELLEELEERGVDAVLIGEALMRADDPEAKVRELTADEQATREHLL